MLQIQINIFRVFLKVMRSRASALRKEKQRSMQNECNFFKYMLGKQQIQQMSLLDEENGTVFFYKLKALFFDENQDDEQILSIIRSEPVKIIGNMLFVLTKSYNQKLTQIIEPLQEEKYGLLQRLSQTKQQLQYSLDDNEYFKAIINKLEEEKKQTEEKLNQSVQQFERSRQDIDYEIHKMQKIQNEVNRIYADAEEIYTQNSQLKHCILEYQQRLATFEEENQRLKHRNNELLIFKEEFTSKYNDTLKNLTIMGEENEELQAKLQERQQFIASFIDEYNKVRLINQNESSSRQYLGMEKIEDEQNYNELQGFNFNNYEQHSNMSEKSLSKDNSLRNLDNEIDDKFQFVNATAEKLKPKIPISHPCVTQEKLNRKIDSKGSSNHKQINSKNKNASNKVEFAKAESNKQVNKTLVKTVSSKNFQQKQSIMVVTPSQGDESKMMEQMLKKKLHQKNHKINRLENEVANLTDRLLQQRNELTIMEGQYEIQIEQLKEKLTFTKTQLLKTYQKYTMVNAECSAYSQKLAELEEQLIIMEQDHRAYCQELKIRCKAYVLKKIDEVENQFESMKQSLNNNQEDSLQQGQSEHQQLEYSIQTQQQLPQEFHLQFKETPVQRHQQSCKIDSFSEIHSYQRLPNHQLNGFDFQFSTKLSNMDQNNEKIYEQENYEIKTNLAILTERFIKDRVEIRDMRRATLTDRCNHLNVQTNHVDQQQQRQRTLSISTKVVDYNLQIRKQRQLIQMLVVNQKQVSVKPRKFGLFLNISLAHIHESPKSRLQLCQNTWSFQIFTQRKKRFQASRTNNFIFYPPPKKEMNINSVLDYSIPPQQNKVMHYSSIVNFHFIPIEKRLRLQGKLNQFSRQMKRLIKLDICQMQSSTYEMPTKRKMSIANFQINMSERIFKTPRIHNFYSLNCIQIQKQPKNLQTQSNICIYSSINQMNRRQESAQTCNKQFADASTQMMVETGSLNTQTDTEFIDSASQTHSSCFQTSVQTQYSMKCSQSQTSLCTSSLETQTNNPTEFKDKAIQTQIKTFSEVQTETQSNFARLKMINNIDILIKPQENAFSNRFQSQILNYTYIPQKRALKIEQNVYEVLIPQQNKQFLSIYCVVEENMEVRKQRDFIIAAQINIYQQAIKFLKINDICPSEFIHIQSIHQVLKEKSTKKENIFSMARQIDLKISELPQKPQQHAFDLIKIPSFHTQTHFECEDNSEFSCYDSLISNKAIEENLSTKNDEVVQTKLDNQYLAIYQRLQMISDENKEEQRSIDGKSAQTPRFTQQNISEAHDSILNKAIVMSDNNSLKVQGKTCNPESKSYKTQYRSTNQISISPWLFDEIGQIMQQSSSNKCAVPVELSSRLTKQREQMLLKYLRRHNIALKFDEEVTKVHFKKPNQLRKKIHFAFVKNDKENEIFMITKAKIYNLRNNRHIILEPSREIDEKNFIFGQSQVIITGDRMLIIKRKGKEMKLSGDLQDGKWEIQSYITCSYERSKQGSY